jgi:AraC-like DNA-binding protein
MWLTPDRVLYVGLLGNPAERTMGSVSVYIAAEGAIRVKLGAGDWQVGRMAVVPAYMPHQVATEGRLVHVIQAEAETLDLASLPEVLRTSGVVENSAFLERALSAIAGLQALPHFSDLGTLDFDDMFYGAPLPCRRLDPRIQRVVDAIKQHSSSMTTAEDSARSAHLSFSRFLHLFKSEVGVPFRGFRTWKRARGLLNHVNRTVNLAHVAQDTGYPDSTHFSHSIRQIYGLRPSDIFAGSRRLAIHTPSPIAFLN